MNTSTPCFDTNMDVIPMEIYNDFLELEIGRKMLPPYNAHNIILKITKEDRNMSSEVTIIITELDLP